MKKIIGYIRQYLAWASLSVHALCCLLLAALVFANYHWQINGVIKTLAPEQQLACWYSLLLVAFAVPYGLQLLQQPQLFRGQKKLIIFIAVAPLIFAWKMSAQVILLPPTPENFFWNSILYFPAKAVVVFAALLLASRLVQKDETLFGLAAGTGNLKPYFFMLALMVPLIAAAATQPDFLKVYPKYQHLQWAPLSAMQILLYEAAYGSDFFTIEVFFRGFLVVYLSRWAGRHAILPMAVFYCVIHFGKPLGECISSFFGGMLLGIVSYHTRSVWGGLMVHLGIAWLMELPYPLSP